MQYIGKIDTKKFKDIYANILTDDVVLTEERQLHIKLRHAEDYNLFEMYATEIVENPDIILKDCKNTGTAFLIKKLSNTNLNIIIRLVLENDNPHLKNSIMTFYRIRDRNLTKLIKNNKLLYKNE